MNTKVDVLIVDDDLDDLKALTMVLESMGVNVVKAESGDEALRCLLHQDFALILMDLMMPRMNGFETAALIRKRKRSSLTPLVFLTGFDREDTRHLPGYADYHADFLSKPINLQELGDKIKKLSCVQKGPV